MAVPLLGTISALESHHPRGSFATLTSSNVGFINLSENDTYWSENILYSDQTVTPGDGLSGIYANSSGSESAFAYFVHSLLNARGLTDTWGDSPSGAISAWLNYWREGNVTGATNHDIFNDSRIGIGNVAVVALKKLEYGEWIKPLSFTANMTVLGSSTDFIDTLSANNEYGILEADGLSAGVIIYDLGVAIIHGPSEGYISAVTALNNAQFKSTYKTWQMNVFCTASPNQLNIPTNDSAYYIAAVTSDPSKFSALSGYNLGYQWGANNNSSSASRGNYFLLGVTQEPTYVTTVGMYDDDNNLLAVAKLPQPLRRTKSMPITFRIPIDFT